MAATVTMGRTVLPAPAAFSRGAAGTTAGASLAGWPIDPPAVCLGGAGAKVDRVVDVERPEVPATGGLVVVLVVEAVVGDVDDVLVAESVDDVVLEMVDVVVDRSVVDVVAGVEVVVESVVCVGTAPETDDAAIVKYSPAIKTSTPTAIGRTVSIYPRRSDLAHQMHGKILIW
jgi:hypothetical protein